MGDFLSMKTHQSRENLEKKNQERRQSILYLIKSYLIQNGYIRTTESLEKEANLSEQIHVCDNVDLDTILQEYISYYYTKFNKQPSICKRIENIPKKPNTPKKPREIKKEPKEEKAEVTQKPKKEFEISITQLSNKPIDIEQDFSPFPELEITFENKDFLNLIKFLIIDNTKYKNIKWSDCIGMENIIQLLKEAVIFPKLYPNLFKQIDTWKSILLYGPPGTGKTFIAKALASETSAIIINFSASTFISKFRGDSEKMIKTLFDYTRCTVGPIVIFIDELEAFCSKRDEHQHEASRRFKSELLTQMDGMAVQNAFILATTNLPWLIDAAILRRFDKKILVNIPNEINRFKAFKAYLNLEVGSENLYSTYAKATGNYSYSDIKLVCKNAYYNALRREMQNNSFNFESTNENLNLTDDDVLKAINNTRPTRVDIEKYKNWAEQLGCT